MKKKELRDIIRLSPKRQGYKTKKWTGLLVQDIVSKKWNFNICLRTAHLWL